MAIFVTSDWHFNHDREFIWKIRGFSSIKEMNEEIIRRHNEVVKPDDTVYVLGDLMFGGNEKDDKNIEYINRLNGKIIVVCGNHDTKRRKTLYVEKLALPIYDATTLKYQGYHFYLSHYPTVTSDFNETSLKQCVINLFGHTHQITDFYNGIPFMYHVGMDSHNCYPVNLDDALSEMKLEMAMVIEKEN